MKVLEDNWSFTFKHCCVQCKSLLLVHRTDLEETADVGRLTCPLCHVFNFLSFRDIMKDPSFSFCSEKKETIIERATDNTPAITVFL